MPSKIPDQSEADSKGTSLAAVTSPVDGFARQIASGLEETEDEIRNLARSLGTISQDDSLRIAKDVVTQFQPVPQFIWRISSYTLGRAGRINKLSDGNLFGLKKIVLAIAKDRILGKGSTVLSTRAVIDTVSSDVIAAVAVIHALGRRLQTKEFHAVWGPILDDALLRAEIGYFVGTMCEGFGPGRGMLAGFAGRIGLAVLIATGSADQAQAAITLLAGGGRIEEVALELYGCEPLHISSMILSAAGCGKESVLGVAAFTMASRQQVNLEPEQQRWLSALTVTERVRGGEHDSVDESAWNRMGYQSPEERAELVEIVGTLRRRGHGWNWMI
jgi:hypothetical protein